MQVGRMLKLFIILSYTLLTIPISLYIIICVVICQDVNYYHDHVFTVYILLLLVEYKCFYHKHGVLSLYCFHYSLLISH